MLSEMEAIDRELRDDVRRRLVNIVKYVTTQAITRRESWRLMAEMLRSLKPENRMRVIARRDAVEKIVRATLFAAVETKLIPAQDVKLACLQLFSMAEGMSGWYKEGSEYTADRLHHMPPSSSCAQSARKHSRNPKPPQKERQPRWSPTLKTKHLLGERENHKSSFSRRFGHDQPSSVKL
jgi:hypothetical protein